MFSTAETDAHCAQMWPLYESTPVSIEEQLSTADRLGVDLEVVIFPSTELYACRYRNYYKTGKESQ